MTELAIKASNICKQFHINARASTITLIKETFSSNGINTSPFYALSDVSFKVAQGERIGVIGHNGSGKTTLLKLIANLLRPNKGELMVNGSVIYIGGHGIGMLEDLTVWDNIFLYGAIYGIERESLNANFDEIIHWAGLDDFVQTKLKHLSNGMKTRLAFSITRYFDAQIYLLDEALSAGDKNFREKCDTVFEGYKNKGKTFIVVSHTLNFIQGFCSKILWLHKGNVKAFGETDSVLAQYANFKNS